MNLSFQFLWVVFSISFSILTLIWYQQVLFSIFLLALGMTSDEVGQKACIMFFFCSLYIFFVLNVMIFIICFFHFSFPLFSFLFIHIVLWCLWKTNFLPNNNEQSNSIVYEHNKKSINLCRNMFMRCIWLEEKQKKNNDGIICKTRSYLEDTTLGVFSCFCPFHTWVKWGYKLYGKYFSFYQITWALIVTLQWIFLSLKPAFFQQFKAQIIFN